jgi:hypothetical protein
VSIVNGYYCADCADELLAKRGVDPSQGPAAARLQSEERSRTPLGINDPRPGESLGARLNLYA